MYDNKGDRGTSAIGRRSPEECIDHLKYLRSVITEDEMIDSDVYLRLQAAPLSWRALTGVLNGKKRCRRCEKRRRRE